MNPKDLVSLTEEILGTLRQNTDKGFLICSHGPGKAVWLETLQRWQDEFHAIKEASEPDEAHSAAGAIDLGRVKCPRCGAVKSLAHFADGTPWFFKGEDPMHQCAHDLQTKCDKIED